MSLDILTATDWTAWGLAALIALCILWDAVRTSRAAPRARRIICGDEWALLKSQHRQDAFRRHHTRGR